MSGRISNLLLLISFVVAIWVVEGVNALMEHSLNVYGLRPRSIEGLRGILFGPFLHGGFGHLAANTLPLLILGGLVAIRGRSNLSLITAGILLLGGAALWVIGRPALHIGASGLVFGYFGYLVGNGWYERNILSILVALVVIAVFGWGILFGLLPTDQFISWEGHLCGLVAGVVVSWLTRPR